MSETPKEPSPTPVTTTKNTPEITLYIDLVKSLTPPKSPVKSATQDAMEVYEKLKEAMSKYMSNHSFPAVLPNIGKGIPVGWVPAGPVSYPILQPPGYLALDGAIVPSPWKVQSSANEPVMQKQFVPPIGLESKFTDATKKIVKEVMEEKIAQAIEEIAGGKDTEPKSYTLNMKDTVLEPGTPMFELYVQFMSGMLSKEEMSKAKKEVYAIMYGLCNTYQADIEVSRRKRTLEYNCIQLQK